MKSGVFLLVAIFVLIALICIFVLIQLKKVYNYIKKSQKEGIKLKDNKPLLIGVGIFFFLILFICIVRQSNDSEQNIAPLDDSIIVNEKSTYIPTTTDPPYDEDEVYDEEDDDEDESTPKPKSKKAKAKSKIKKVIEDRIWEEYDQTYVDHITVNENLGTKKKGDYIALAYLIWNVKNSGTLSREVLSIYSEDLAAIVGKKCPNVQEIAIFWTVPYLNDASAKCSYERKKGGMYPMDVIFDNNFY